MFFSAYKGTYNNLDKWKELIINHSEWLNFSFQIEVKELNNGDIFAFAWLKHKSVDRTIKYLEINDFIAISTFGDMHYPSNKNPDTLEDFMNANVDKNIIQVGVMKSSSIVNILVPLTTPEQFYFTQDNRGHVFSNDLRLMLNWTGLDIDERGVFGLFKYRSIPAPYTISKNIHRIPNGYMLKLYHDSLMPKLEHSEAIRNHIFTNTEKKINNKDKDLEKILDNILLDAPSSSALFFSGGVDSALLAYRLSEIGRKDVRLMNFTYGEQDPNAIYAKKIADYLNYPIEQIQFNEDAAVNILDNIIRDYSYPFCDPATIPANLLAKKTTEMVTGFSTAIDGTGSDCSFVGDIPVYAKYRKFNQIPLSVRQIMADIYKSLNLWKIDSKAVAPFRAGRRSVLMPIQTLELGNIFDKITYTIPETTKDYLEHAYFVNTQAFYKGLEKNPAYNDFTYTSIINLIYDASNNSASKTFDPLRMRGGKLLCPYMDPDLLKLSFSIPWSIKEAEEPKAILKRILLSKIPRKLVYQPKGIFCPPYNIIMNPKMKEFINDVALASNNPIVDYFDVKIVREILNQTRNNYIDSDFFSFLWSLIFLSGWINQYKSIQKSNLCSLKQI